MSELLFKCPHCSKSLAVDRTGVGRMCRCTDCKAEIRIPEAELEFNCPSCKHALRTPSELSGTTLSCPNCNSDITVPQPPKPDKAATAVQWLDDGEGLKFHCPSCDQHLAAEAEMSGQCIDCPSCGTCIQLPARPAPNRPIHPPIPAPQRMPGVGKTKPTTSKERPCPFCGENILKVAVKCRHCGSNLALSPTVPPTQVSQIGEKLRDAVLILIACLSLVAFFMPNISVSLPIIGKLDYSMYNAVMMFTQKTSSQEVNTEQAIHVDAKKAVQSFWEGHSKDGFDPATAGTLICAVGVLGLLLHYALSVLWLLVRFILGRSGAAMRSLWLVCAIQFPVLFTVGSNIVLSSFRKAMTDKDGGDFAAVANALVARFSMDVGTIMWVLCIAAVCGLAIPVIVRSVMDKPAK